MKLSVLIPVYNERETIEEIIDQVRKVNLADGLEKELVIVDDGSTDGSRDILERLPVSTEMRIVFHEVNQGKGAAVRTAIQHAQGDVFLIQDADLEYDPREYNSLLRPILENRTKVVYGSRFLGGPRKTMFFSHMIGNKLLTFVTNLLYDTILSDMETCYKVFTNDVVRDMPLRSRRFRAGARVDGQDPEARLSDLRSPHQLLRARVLRGQEDLLARWIQCNVDADQIPDRGLTRGGCGSTVGLLECSAQEVVRLERI